MADLTGQPRRWDQLAARTDIPALHVLELADQLELSKPISVPAYGACSTP
jgi:N-glycosylase/DNA lyase